MTKKAGFPFTGKPAFFVPMSEFLITCVENVMEMGKVLGYNGLENVKLVQDANEQGRGQENAALTPFSGAGPGHARLHHSTRPGTAGDS